MKPISLNEVAQWTQGILESKNGERCITRVHTDSRTVQPGDLFVALKGENHDGHIFVSEVFEKGAIAALVDSDYKREGAEKEVALVRVQDSLKGLQDLAKGYRQKLGTKIVAITGSNGKTSAKEYMASVLSTQFRTHRNKGNLNNHIGVPLTLLELNQNDEWGVVEMGMNHPGEIQMLVNIAEPDIGVITNVGWAHIEAFENQEGIAFEKSQVIRALPANGFAVLQGDDDRISRVVEEVNCRKVFAGQSDRNKYRLNNVICSELGTSFQLVAEGKEIEITLSQVGVHMAKNAMLAAAVGIEIGLSLDQVKEGLENCVLPGGRMEISAFSEGWLIDDTYNANPDSVLAAFQTVRHLRGAGRGVALLGSMGELGERSVELHRFVGKNAVHEGMETVFSLGEFGGEIALGAQEGGLSSEFAQSFDKHEDLVEAYWALAEKNDKILVKGSRAEHMERVVELMKSGKGNN